MTGRNGRTLRHLRCLRVETDNLFPRLHLRHVYYPRSLPQEVSHQTEEGDSKAEPCGSYNRGRQWFC